MWNATDAAGWNPFALPEKEDKSEVPGGATTIAPASFLESHVSRDYSQRWVGARVSFFLFLRREGGCGLGLVRAGGLIATKRDAHLEFSSLRCRAADDGI